MRVRRGSIADVWIFERPVHADARGFFHEAFRASDLTATIGRDVRFVQVNHSRSARGVLRGLHAENWEKLVYVPSGEVFTAIADIRPGSPTSGRVETFWFSDANRPAVYLPAAVAHGYCVLSEMADYIYQVTAYYDGTDTAAVAWDDPDLAVPWPIRTPILSERDRANPRLRDLLWSPGNFPQGLASKT